MSFRCKLTKKTERAEHRRSCTKCGRIGHLAGGCENPDKRHDRIGIEIEGFWRDLATAQRLANELCGHTGTRDGSIVPTSTCGGADADCDCDGAGCDACEETEVCEWSTRGQCKICGMASWEFQTQPGTIGEALRQLTKLYPDATSGACGLHVHMSFLDKSDVTMLTGEAFFQHFRDKFKAWGERLDIQGAFWDRLEGKNRYCLINTIEDWQDQPIVTHTRDRYRQINFAAYSEHTTVEFRLLPMFQRADIAVKAIEELIDIVETYLADARLDLAADVSRSAIPIQGSEASNVDAEIPTEISDAARDQLLPREISRDVEIADMDLKTPGSVILPAWKAAAMGQAELTKIVNQHFGPAGSKLRKLGAGTPVT